ncbi:hypothetical protein HD554DRAFT_2128293 [Boletus coccyginus]|nr:hypothetical protein HD554DRAFT_2128293 [Boletus coccyginus]
MPSLSPAYFQWLRKQQTIKYCRVAPLSIWMFDYLLTFEEEVRLMNNKGSWGITHVLYIPTRFFPLIGSLCAVYNALVLTRPLATCIALYRIAEITLFLGMFAAEGLLLIRTMALWSHKRIVCQALMVTYGIVGTVMLVCSIISTTLKFEAICTETTSSVTTAFATRLSQVTVGMFSSAAFFELVVLALTLLHGYMLRRSGLRTMGNVAASVTQGNIAYTLSIFLTSIANITFFLLPLQDGWNGLLTTFQGVLHGVVASRILFNLRDALHNQGDVVTFSMSRMQFATIPKGVTQGVESSA